MNALERLELECNCHITDDYDWEHPVFTIDTDEAFRDLEQPQVRYVWDADTPDWMLGATKLDKENFPMLTDSWQPGNVRGE